MGVTGTCCWVMAPVNPHQKIPVKIPVKVQRRETVRVPTWALGAVFGMLFLVLTICITGHMYSYDLLLHSTFWCMNFMIQASGMFIRAVCTLYFAACTLRPCPT